MMRGFVYLASPYSLFEGGTENAFREAAKATAELIAAGYNTYSPIVHSHPVAQIGGLDAMDGEMWLELDGPMMEAAAGLVVLMLDGWDRSHGVAAEMEYFARAEKPIVLMAPGEVPDMTGVFG
jgi:nucleoside 2-deoxyribosyltransferase